MIKKICVVAILIIIILLAGCISSQTPIVPNSSTSTITPTIKNIPIKNSNTSIVITKTPTKIPEVTPITTTITPVITAIFTPIPVISKSKSTVKIVSDPVARAASSPSEIGIISGIIGGQDVTIQMIVNLQPMKKYGVGTPEYNPCGTSLFWDNTSISEGNTVINKIYTNSSEMQFCFSFLVPAYPNSTHLNEIQTSPAVITYTYNGVQRTITAPALTQIIL